MGSATFGWQGPFSPMCCASSVLERLSVCLDTSWNFQVHFAIDRCFRFLVAQILYPHLGMLLSIEVVIDTHPFVQISGEDRIKSGWQKIMLGFEARERRTNWDGSSGFVVAYQIQMIGHSFSSGFDLISLLLGQFEKTISDSQVAEPD